MEKLTLKHQCQECGKEHCKQLNWVKDTHKWICVSCDRKMFKLERERMEFSTKTGKYAIYR